MGGLMTGFWWTIGRRAKLQQEAAQRAAAGEEGNPTAPEDASSSETGDEKTA
jgi:hypothetical protein